MAKKKECTLEIQWHGASAAKKLVCRRVDGVLEGDYRAYHANGMLKECGKMKSGQREGVWLEYHDTGEIKSTCYYKDGIPWGGRTTFLSSAIPAGIETYADGEKDGYSSLLSLIPAMRKRKEKK